MAQLQNGIAQRPTPAFWQYRALFILMGWQSLWRTVLGLILAVIFGTLIGMVMGFSRVARDALYPLLVGFNAIPKATLVPIIALIFIGQHNFNTVLIALAAPGILLYYAVVMLERIFAGWAERPTT